MSISKKILIVGGASGIGWATAQHLLSQASYEVLIADCDPKRLGELRTQKELKNLTVFEMDLTDRQSTIQALDFLKNRYGKIDAVIITAAIHTCYPIEHLTDAMIDNVLNVNLISQIKFIKNILPYIQEGGHLIGTGSIAAGIGVPMESLYSASKAGLEIFFQCLAVELQHRKIHVSIIHPGNVNTGFNEKGNDYPLTGHPTTNEGYSRVVAKIDSSLGISPHYVAQTIFRALQEKQPKFFHVVGMNAKKAYWAKRLLGNNFSLRLMAKHFGF